MSCDDCAQPVPAEHEHCPHCGRPSLFPNVRKAREAALSSALARRHQTALERAASRGTAAVASSFETAAGSSRAVMARPVEEALRLVKEDHQAYASFYSLLHAGARLPDDSPWTRLRGLADMELFGTYRDKIRFAALSLNGQSLPHYGEVHLELADEMVAHRATVFEENSAVFFDRQRRKGNEPCDYTGHLGDWESRGKLALAKHVNDIHPTSDPSDFPALLQRPGADPSDDIFIEVHVFGSLTRRSLSRVVVQGKLGNAYVEDLMSRLSSVGVPVEKT